MTRQLKAYRLKPGVVLFDLCGETFLFPSRSSDAGLRFLITVPQPLAALLRQQRGAGPDLLPGDAEQKLQRLLKYGLIEEY